MKHWEICEGGKMRKVASLILSPGVQTSIIFRFGQWTLKRNILFKTIFSILYFFINTFVSRIMWGIDIPRHAKIGPGLYIGHFGGITISPHAVIGSNCNIAQNVTIGISGKGEKRGVPIIGNDVYIAPGARVFGKIVVGNNVKIGANAVIYKDIPDNAIVVLEPGFKIISFEGNRPYKPSLSSDLFKGAETHLKR
jgi:serine O-acetyltransferase